MGSSRLPGKVLEPIEGRPLLVRIAERLSKVRGLQATVILTSRLPGDEPIADLCRQTGLACIRGDQDDVLDRFQLAARELAPTRVVRITADCPLLDPDVISELLTLHDSRPDLVYASVATGAIGADAGYRRFPDGLDAEVLSAASLAQAWNEARDPFEREHVTPFIWRHPERFSSAVLECEVDLGDERWTVDFPDDLAFVRAVYSRLGQQPSGWREVLELLQREPELRRLNQRHRVTAD